MAEPPNAMLLCGHPGGGRGVLPPRYRSSAQLALVPTAGALGTQMATGWEMLFLGGLFAEQRLQMARAMMPRCRRAPLRGFGAPISPATCLQGRWRLAGLHTPGQTPVPPSGTHAVSRRPARCSARRGRDRAGQPGTLPAVSFELDPVCCTSRPLRGPPVGPGPGGPLIPAWRLLSWAVWGPA
jgi:hypothetical protein